VPALAQSEAGIPVESQGGQVLKRRWALGLRAGGAACLVCAALGQVPAQVRTDSAAAGASAIQFDAFRGDRPYNWPGQSRSEVVARNGVVATSHPLAAEAGLEILHAGGNAFDAAVAMAAVMNVVEPEAAGIGGDAFVLAWSAKDKKLVALDGSGRAPSGATPERFLARNAKNVPFNGVDSAVVPGAVDAWDVLLKRYGSMGFKQVLAPATRIADEGFGVTERIAAEWEGRTAFLKEDAETARVYLNNGKAPGVYSIFRNPDLAKAFRLLGSGGRDAFYKGPIAKAIVARSQASGGGFALPDFDKIHARWVDPITTSFNGYDVYQMPPSTQGFAVLEMMNILDVCPAKLGLDPARLTPKSADYWHLMVEAKKLAYDDLEQYDGDPDFTDVPVSRLISKAYAAEQCGRIDMKKAGLPKTAAAPIGGTVYLTTADRYGNVVSFIFSVYGIFGSGVTVPGYGFLLNNRAAEFSLDPKSPNVIAPGKRPFYTIIPGFVMKQGKPFLSYGVMYGDQQAQGQAQVLANILKFGANPQAASDAARFSHTQRNNRLTLESALFDTLGADLTARGHTVVRGNGAPMGGYQAIMIDPQSGVYRGASDHRKDGQAIGY
jgi:gamma-glutamyltranspeptidase/glutathione hydrolase